ncbi:MAG TPA: CRISPR-associated protein [Bacteroidales bacterium]|nr:CRISPR-associated protein [Bacteroidales bacterium]
MLINLSNHPFQNWDKKQTEAAQTAYGSIIDLRFPQIDPEWDIEQIINIAVKYFKKIDIELKKSTENNNAVHLMGELTFCFCLASLLQKNEITCIASTTKRNVTENVGVKTSVFEFVKFRKYF